MSSFSYSSSIMPTSSHFVMGSLKGHFIPFHLARSVVTLICGDLSFWFGLIAVEALVLQTKLWIKRRVSFEVVFSSGTPMKRTVSLGSSSIKSLATAWNSRASPSSSICTQRLHEHTHTHTCTHTSIHTHVHTYTHTIWTSSVLLIQLASNETARAH